MIIKATISSIKAGFLPLVLFCLFLTGCQAVDVRGQYISDALIEKINNSSMTKDQVMEDVGSPTYVPEYSPNTWYYIQRSQTRRAWFWPKVVEQRIVKVAFNSKDVAIGAELVENTHKDAVKINSSYTETKGTEKSGVQKFVGNIGRFNKSSNSKKRSKDKK